MTYYLQVQASDPDLANNGEVTYSFASQSAHLEQMFSIDPHNGWISTQADLDYETVQQYTLHIVATDNGKQKLASEARVQINLMDTNDNPPEFSQLLYTAAVNEGALPGTVIFQLQVTDADKDIRSDIMYFISNGDLNGQFQVKRNGEVYVAGALDRETRKDYRLEIVATDGLYVAHTKVLIELLDENDSPPVCIQYEYVERISENLLPGTNILTITATDADEEQNARQSFSLSGPTREYFSIHAETGQLSTALMLDREQIDEHHLVVRVADRDEPAWFCESKVVLHIMDANDNKPMFDADELNAVVAEDAAIGRIVTKVHATDLDLGDNRQITYSLIDSADGHFDIEPENGLIRVNRELDREARDMYNLSVRAMDAGRPRLTAVAHILVRVLGKIQLFVVMLLHKTYGLLVSWT